MNVFVLMQECSLQTHIIMWLRSGFFMLSCVSYSCLLLLISACLVCVKWINMDSVIDLQLVKQLTCLRPVSCSVILQNSNIKHHEGQINALIQTHAYCMGIDHMNFDHYLETAYYFISMNECTLSTYYNVYF